MAKDQDYIRLINTSRWRKLRAIALHEHPLCVECEKQGYITAATEVHHVTPVESATFRMDKERLMFDKSNLMPLCRRCHKEIHLRNKEQDRNSRKREELIRRMFSDE